MNNGSTPELYRKLVHPRGWPYPVEIRELTAGDMLDLYDKIQSAEEKQIQYEILMVCAHVPETGNLMFKSMADIRALPARMLPGLLELLKACTELNTVVAPEGVERPTSRPEENNSSA